MARIATVTFEHVQGPHHYRLEADGLAPRSQVVATTRFGPAVGELVLPPYEATGANLPVELAVPAGSRDLERHRDNGELSRKSLFSGAEMVLRHGLQMKLARAFWSLDREQLTFFFSAPGRVDFRSLLRDLVREFRTQIRLEQVGDRDVARLLGGLGRCGREICCRRWMPCFQPVSINHAREQGLPPIPGQLAGCCGRLRCCLRFERDEPDELDLQAAARAAQRRRPVKTATYRTYYDDDDDPRHFEDET